MKTIGLLGGMSWESTLEYYRIINQEVKARLAGCIRPAASCTPWILPRWSRISTGGGWSSATGSM